MKNVEALKKLYAAISGGVTAAIESDNTIAEVVDHLAGLMGDVMENTTELLTPFEITLTATSASSGTSDKTAQEIAEAVGAGKQVVVYIEFGGAEQTLSPILFGTKDGEITLQVIGMQEPSGVLFEAFMPWSKDDDNTWTLKTYQLTEAE